MIQHERAVNFDFHTGPQRRRGEDAPVLPALGQQGRGAGADASGTRGLPSESARPGLRSYDKFRVAVSGYFKKHITRDIETGDAGTSATDSS